MDKIKVPIMILKVSIDGEDKTFTTPLAENILTQLKEVEVGKGQIKYFDVTDKKFKSFTYCCGDKNEFNYTTKEVTLKTTEFDCSGFPVTYKGDK